MRVYSGWLLSSIDTARARERGSRSKCSHQQSSLPPSLLIGRQAAVAVLIGLTAWVVSLLAGNPTVLAQSSVEKMPTTSEAKQPVDSSQTAAEVVQNPNAKLNPEQPGRVTGDYVWSSAAEIGYRFVDSDGSRDRFLSDLYLRNGLRLLDLHMDARSISGNGLFDFMRADVVNGGSDDSEYYNLRMEKARRYIFDANVRKFNFYEYLPSFALGEHNFNLDQRVSDFNLKLFPQRYVRLNLGYSRSSAAGPLATTYGVEGDTFPINGQSRWESNNYRASMDTSYRRWDFSLGGIYSYFKNDTQYFQDAGTVNLGNNTALTSSSLDFFNRDQPTRSKAATVHGNIRGDLTRRLHLVLVGSHTEDNLNANQFDQLTGTDMAGIGGDFLLSQIGAIGNVKETSASSDLALTYDLTENMSLSDSISYYSFKVAGDVNTMTQSGTQPPGGALIDTVTNAFDSRLTDYRSYWNTLQLQYNLGRKFSVNGGWRAIHRNVTLASANGVGDSYPQTTNTFIGGLRFRPGKNTSLFFDYERGETDNAFVRINPLAYRRFRVRANVKVTNNFSIDSALTTTDTANPEAQVNQEGDFRNVSVSATWEPKERLWLTGGYDYDYLFNIADIIYYIRSQQNQGRSIYYSRQNSVFFDSRFGLTRRLDIFLIYRYLQDRGAPGALGFPITATDLVNSLPLHRHNPEARISYRFNNRIIGNISFRHYSYNETILNPEDYRANVLTTSLRIVF